MGAKEEGGSMWERQALPGFAYSCWEGRVKVRFDRGVLFKKGWAGCVFGPGLGFGF